MNSNFNQDIQYLYNSLQDAKFIYAKSMPNMPHYYTLRKDWNDDDFVKTVKLIRQYGRQENFYKNKYIYFYINGYKYWTMGCPLHNCNKTGTILINKAEVKYSTFYDDIASDYTNVFSSSVFQDEDKKLFDILNISSNAKILDIGCGDGMFLNYNSPSEYVGIDISSKFINIALNNHQGNNSSFINCSLEDYFSNNQFDCIVSLYGSPSYIDKNILMNKIKSFLKPTGCFYLMFYDVEYTPFTHTNYNIIDPLHSKTNKGDLLFNKYRLITRYEDL